MEVKATGSCQRFSLADIQSATHEFDDELVLGKGGFGKVYKGIIDNGAITVAVKRLNPMSEQGAPEFLTEIETLSKIRHVHIVSLIGYCNESNEMILVYKYMVGGTLADHLHRNDVNTWTLSWVQRLKICIGAARGLDYLHTGMESVILHRDVKSSNILLDINWAAKISDFGLSKIGPANQSCTHVSTDVKGTWGYIDPQYLLTHKLTTKSDVYSFGVVLLEVLCGRRAVDFRLDQEQRSLVGWAQDCIKAGTLHQIIDPNLREILPSSLTVFAQIANQCVHILSKKRPTMTEVVVSLQSALALQERTESSMFDSKMDNFYAGQAYDNEERTDSSMNLQKIIHNADKGGHHNEQIDGRLGDTSSGQSRVKLGRIMAFIKRLGFYGTIPVTSVAGMGKRLDALFGRKIETSKLKYTIYHAIYRLPVLKKQYQERHSEAQSDVVQLLITGNHEQALSQVLQVIMDQNRLDAFVMIESYCHLLIERVNLIEQPKVCPDELKEAISSLVFAATRIRDMPELQEIRSVFASYFGRKFDAAATDISNNYGIIQKLSLEPSLESRLKVLKEIASANGIFLQ